MKGEELKFEDLKINMQVVDEDDDVAVVISLENMYNVELQYGTTGKGFCCIAENCCNEKLYKYEK